MNLALTRSGEEPLTVDYTCKDHFPPSETLIKNLFGQSVHRIHHLTIKANLRYWARLFPSNSEFPSLQTLVLDKAVGALTQFPSFLLDTQVIRDLKVSGEWIINTPLLVFRLTLYSLMPYRGEGIIKFSLDDTIKALNCMSQLEHLFIEQF